MDECKKKKLSAVIACYLDAPAIPYMYQRLSIIFQKIDVDYELIFVNDCSPDNAREVLAQLCKKDKKVIAINHTRNFGSQSAFTSGMRIASGDAVILLDGDLQDPPELIEQFFQKWQQGYDVIYGIRVKRDATLFIQLASKIFYRFFCLSSYISIPVDAGDFSLLDRKVVDALNSLPENNRFLRGLRSWVGFKQIGVDYARPKRMFGRTTNSFLKDLSWARKAIVSFSYMPMDLIVWLALVTVSCSVVGMAFQLALRILYPTLTPPGFTTLILIILFVGGVQLTCLSIIGSYLSHIYDEVKRRPPYIVESFFNYSSGQVNKKNE
jgi:glycosyltransferase involved in cell wall biosynthesis